jgi:hypothetical protein
MARRNQSTGKPVEYVNLETGEHVGAYAGTEQDKVYRDDPDYDIVGRRPSAPSKVAAATTEDGEGDRKSVDLDGLSRADLDALAVEKGVENPGDLPNKDAVKAAIAAATTEDGE